MSNSNSSSTTTSTTSVYVSPVDEHKYKQRVIILGKQRRDENNIRDADEVTSMILGTKRYHISDEEVARRRKRDIEFYALKQKLGNLNNSELAELNALVKQEIQRRGR